MQSFGPDSDPEFDPDSSEPARGAFPRAIRFTRDDYCPRSLRRELALADPSIEEALAFCAASGVSIDRKLCRNLAECASAGEALDLWAVFADEGDFTELTIRDDRVVWVNGGAVLDDRSFVLYPFSDRLGEVADRFMSHKYHGVPGVRFGSGLQRGSFRVELTWDFDGRELNPEIARARWERFDAVQSALGLAPVMHNFGDLVTEPNPCMLGERLSLGKFTADVTAIPRAFAAPISEPLGEAAPGQSLDFSPPRADMLVSVLRLTDLAFHPELVDHALAVVRGVQRLNPDICESLAANGRCMTVREVRSHVRASSSVESYSSLWILDEDGGAFGPMELVIEPQTMDDQDTGLVEQMRAQLNWFGTRTEVGRLPWDEIRKAAGYSR